MALVVYEADQKKGIRPVQLETWPQDPAEFNRILSRYKASKDAAAPGFLKRSVSLSDFYEAKKKKDDDSDDGNGGDDSDGDDGNDNDDDHVDPKVQKRGNKQISKDNSSKIPQHLKPANFDVQKPPSHDPVNTFIHDTLGKKVTHELAQWGGFNKNPVNTTTTTPTTSVMQSKNPMNTSTTCTTTSNSAIQSKSSPSVKCPMLPSAWISISQSQKT
ncbi:unnamed protein product [Malus baccata var. baccata]